MSPPPPAHFNRTGCRYAGLIVALLASSVPVFATPTTLHPLDVSARLSALYQQLGASFWRGEQQLIARSEANAITYADVSCFRPLEKDDPLRAEYARAAAAADAYLKLADANQSGTWTRAPVYYLGGLAKYSLGDEAGALRLLERLQREVPGYQRDFYYNDRDAPDPNFATPTAPGISKLVFFLKLQLALKHTSNAFASLKEITSDALTALSAKNAYIALLVSRGTKYNPYYASQFDEARFGEEPDQRRAGALPSTLLLVQQAWDKLLPGAVKADAKGVRAWLRGLSAPEAPLARLALYRLQGIDELIIKQYFAEARQAMNAHNYDGARAKYRQIIAEYPETDAAQRANDALPKIVPVAVAFYKSEGEKNFQPVNQPGVAQSKSREDFEKLLREDPDSDVGAYYLARSLATENKTDQALAYLRDFEKKHPNSPLQAAALFQQGFLLASRKKPDYAKAVQLMDRVAKEYPSSREAPEALFYAGTYLAWQSRFPEAIARLSQIEKYPKSIRTKWSKSFIAYLQGKVKDGTQWP